MIVSCVHKAELLTQLMCCDCMNFCKINCHTAYCVKFCFLFSSKPNMVFFDLQVLECGVCEDVFSLQGDKVPRLLLCGHTVCHDCLTRLPLHGRAVRCPFDRQVTELGKKIQV